MRIRLYSALRKLKEQEIALLQEAAQLELTLRGEQLRDPTHPTRMRIRMLDERLLQLLREQRDIRQQQVSKYEFAAQSDGALRLHKSSLENCRRKIEELKRKLT